MCASVRARRWLGLQPHQVAGRAYLAAKPFPPPPVDVSHGAENARSAFRRGAPGHARGLTARWLCTPAGKMCGNARILRSMCADESPHMCAYAVHRADRKLEIANWYCEKWIEDFGRRC